MKDAVIMIGEIFIHSLHACCKFSLILANIT